MGKRITVRDAFYWDAEQSDCQGLQARTRRNGYPVLATYDRLKPIHRAKIESYHRFALRPPKDWYRQLKRRSEDERFIDLVRFAFARYPVPAHLENLWLSDIDDDFIDDVQPRSLRANIRRGSARPDLIYWYIIVAQGGSLHKQAAHHYLSSLETHHYLNAPTRIASSQLALWYAVARAATDTPITAARIARTKLTDFSIASAYWRDVARFFARHVVAIEEMNDLIDFLAWAKTQDTDFSLKGRTVPALRKRMVEWHRSLGMPREDCVYWPGAPIPDAEYEIETSGNVRIWRFRQITNGYDLFHEGQRMHHCVASYQTLCINGDVSIWSLTCESPPSFPKRCLTIELRRGGWVAQCRGFDNRQLTGEEIAMVARWTHDHKLGCGGGERLYRR